MTESKLFCPATALHWHDWWIHAVGFSREDRQITFDVDAGIQWTVAAGNIDVELVPALVRFHNVARWEFDVGSIFCGIEVGRVDVSLESRTSELALWKWQMDCNEGAIVVIAEEVSVEPLGQPRAGSRTRLPHQERGGFMLRS